MPKPKASPDASIAPLVDEIGDLHKELDPLKPKIARLELLRKTLRTHYANAAADSYQTADGQRYQILIGPRENERKVNVPALIKAVGSKLFARIASVTLAALEREAPHAVSAEGVVTISATGSRSLKVLEKGKAL